MPYDENLAERVRAALGKRRGLEEKTMFGGLCFMLDGHMACGVVRDDLVVRVHDADYANRIAEPHARPMDFTGRPLKGFVYVGPKATARKAGLEKWVRRSVDHITSLPPKKRKKKAAKKIETRKVTPPKGRWAGPRAGKKSRKKSGERSARG